MSLLLLCVLICMQLGLHYLATLPQVQPKDAALSACVNTCNCEIWNAPPRYNRATSIHLTSTIESKASYHKLMNGSWSPSPCYTFAVSHTVIHVCFPQLPGLPLLQSSPPIQYAGGRYLNDVWLLNLDTLMWQLVTTTAKPLPPIGGGKFDEIEPAVSEPLLGNHDDNKPGTSAALPPSAGHILVAWGSRLLCIGGHTKAGTYSHSRKVFTS